MHFGTPLSVYPRNSNFLALQKNRFFADYFVFEGKKSTQNFGYYSDEVWNLVSNTYKFESDGVHGGMYLF